jgi:DNA ligase (NAD+)
LLKPEQAHQRIVTLRAEIAHHDALYFQRAKLEISDAAYDALKRELRALEQAFPAEAATIVPLPALTDDHSEGFAKAAHRSPMLSLDKAYTEAEVRSFFARVTPPLGHPADLVVEPKIDGVAVSAIYEHGRFVRAITRGNGREGDDITANARAIRSLPRELSATNPDGTPNPIPDFIELRGEIYLSRVEFAWLNKEREHTGEAPLAHPRNVAAGTIKSRDPNETAERHLDVVFYGWGACEPASALPASQQAFHQRARAWGLPILETYQVVHNTDEAWAAVQALGKRRDKLTAPTDGAVLKLNDIPSRQQFGESEQAPRWAIAFKYTPERVTTQLLSITIQVGRTGSLTPVAELEPITLKGSKIARATLHNRDQIARLDLRVGDYVFLEKAGEIIPEIVGVDLSRRASQSEPYVFPTECPSCGSRVVADEDAAAVRCPNSTRCQAQLRQRLAHFAGKTGVSIAGLGDTTIAELFATDQVHYVSDLYSLEKEGLMKLHNFGEKSAAQMIAKIEHSRRAELWRFINGLSIPHVGPASAKILARHFGSLEKLATAQPTELPGELGDATTQAIAKYFAVPENRAVVIALSKAVLPSTSPSSNSRLNGKTFILTGRLPTLSREEVTSRIEAAGGEVHDSVSMATDYVVAENDAGEKLTKAQYLGVVVIDEAELLRLLNEVHPDAQPPKK